MPAGPLAAGCARHRPRWSGARTGGELRRVGAGFRMGRAVGITFEGDRRHGDDRALGQLLFEIVVLCLALGQAEAPAVVVDHDADVIRVVKGRGAPVERRIVEVPLGRGGVPDEPRELAPVSVIARPAAIGGEVELVPPGEFGRREQGRLAGFLIADQVPADRHDGPAPFGPKGGHDVSRPCPPVESADDRVGDAESVHERDDVDPEDRLLAVPDRGIGEEAGRAVAAQVGNDHPAPGRCQQRGDLGVAVDVVGPPVQQDDRRAIARTGFGVPDAQHARVDLFRHAERTLRVRRHRRLPA
jgi:hypothetical protein